MLSQGDSLGVFQVESRAQMSMLPRLRPKCFYDLVIQIAIVRPGPIQGDMVHPYLRRRDGLEKIEYQNDEIKSVLSPTLGIPIFQEQAIRLAMVAAGFSGGEADQLRRAMASWGKSGSLLKFEQKFIQGMLDNGYELTYAQRLFEQIKGFGGYGFPESHSASFALLCYASSWLKCHHPAAFYCALLNSQPMGFYSPSQLMQDARRHHVEVLPVDINLSRYECHIEKIKQQDSSWAIRLGFIYVKGLDKHNAQKIEETPERPFHNLKAVQQYTPLTRHDLECLASADAFSSLLGNRYQSRWHTVALKNQIELENYSQQQGSRRQDQQADFNNNDLVTPSPSLSDEILTDYQTVGLSLRTHPMRLLREHMPFKRCKKRSDLLHLSNGRFVQVAGIVTGRQRPGTAKGTLFLTLEDETGNINVIVWKRTQDLYREALLTSKLLLIKGRLEISNNVHHVIAGQLIDYTHEINGLTLKSRDFH